MHNLCRIVYNTSICSFLLSEITFSFLIHVHYTAKEQPEIQMAIYNVSTNTLDVTWSTTIENIVLIAINTESGNEYSVVVGPNKRTLAVAVDPAPYNITIVVFDICGKNYSSVTVFVDRGIDPSSATLSGTILQSTTIPLTTFETSYAETSSHHYTMYTVEHRFSFDTCTPEPSIHYCPENTGNEECFIHGIILYLHKIFTSNIDSEAAATLAWSLGLIVLIFCSIMSLLISCVLYWKMKGIEGKSSSILCMISVYIPISSCSNCFDTNQII